MTIPPEDIIYFILGILDLLLSMVAVYVWIEVVFLSKKIVNHQDRKAVDKWALGISILNLILYTWIFIDNIPELYDMSSFPPVAVISRIVRTFSLIGWNILALYHFRIKPEDIIQ